MHKKLKISYIDENEKRVSPDYFLEPFIELGMDTKRVLEFIKMIDYTGNISISKREFDNFLDNADPKIKEFLKKAACIKNGEVHLRGKEYHLNISLGSDVEKIRSRMLENCKSLENIAIPSGIELGNKLSEKAIYSCILDHQKHYSLCMLFGLYNAMLDNENISKREFEITLNFCKSAIDNYYAFILGKESLGTVGMQENLESLFRRISLPKDSKLSPKETGSRKMVLREMDHPGQIILFGGNVLKYDGKQKIDVVVNPLYGEIEIGFALKRIYELYDVPKIGSIRFIRYSRYSESHESISRGRLTEHIPECLIENFEEIEGKRVYVFDDNAFMGESMKELRNFLSNYTSDINLAVIERPVDLRKKRDDLINPEELDIPVISKIRYVDKLEKIINNRLNL